MPDDLTNLVATDPGDAFPVVGIGGGGGGLSALLGVLEHLPVDCDMAIVAVLDMPARDDDSAISVIARSSALPVVPVTGEATIEPGRVYLAAPRHEPEIVDGVIRTDRRAAGTYSIDRFFRSLADAYQSRAIAVVLSGAGSDGATGLARVREQGGVTLAQSPLDADHGAMPRAAIAAGSVDFVLPAADIARRLLALGDSPGRWRSDPANVEVRGQADDSQALADIMDVLRMRTRHDFSHYKPATLLRRIGRRLHLNGLPDLAAYRDHLREHAEETAPLLQDLLISVTSFFRDRAAMQSLERNVLPSLLKGRSADEPVRVWVVGCATGEEAWSIAIMLSEQLAALSDPPGWQVFATDIDDRAIAVARNGLYSGAIAQDVGPERLQAFFTREDGSFRVKESLRDSVLFASHNVLNDAPFARLDLILCRNLLIYLERDVQAEIIERLRRSLKPGGHLFLGLSETPDSVPGAFTPIDEKHRIYLADDEMLTRRPATGSGRADPALGAGSRARASVPEAASEVRAERMHASVLLDACPASVLVDANLDIIHLAAGAARFMVHPTGTPSANLMANVHPDLRLELRGALMAAAESGRPVKVSRVPLVWEQSGLQARGAVDLQVLPGRDPESGGQIIVVVFEDASPRDEGDADPALAQENRRLREQLGATIERFDASTEELRASNAELARINDELRRATEELATRKEELQSANEELLAVNQEMKAKVDETVRIQDDLVNLSAAGSVIALFLDRAMNVKRFTPAAAERFGLSASAPQSLADIAAAFDESHLVEDASESFQALKPIERFVREPGGRSYLARIQPYRTLRDNIEGAVLHFADVTPLRNLQERLDDTLEVLELGAQAAERHAVVTLDEHGGIQSWHADAVRMFRRDGERMIGEAFEALFATDERQRGLPQATLREARDRGRAEADLVLQREDGHAFPGRCIVTARRRDPHRGFVVAIQDRSDQQRMQDARDEIATREQTLAFERDASRRNQDESLEALASTLKRPLSLIQVNAEMLMRLPETRNIPVVGKMAESIGKAVATQASVLDEMQDLSLARTGKLPLKIQTVSLREPIEAIVNEMKERAHARSLALDFEGPGEPLLATADPARIAQMTRILVRNAIRFTEQGAIAVRLSRDGRQARLTVADTGAGIAPESLEAVFEPFDRPSVPGHPRPQRGPGIGLALVRELATLHEGRIVADSEGPGHGATFNLWLPLVMPVETAPTPSAGADNPLAGMRIVLVDDSTDLLSSFGALLGLEGAIVDTFDDARAALGHLLENEADLLISDLGMPGMDGYQLVEELRRHPALAALPAIALTGYGRTRDPAHAVRVGFNAHTTKPATVEEVKNIVALLKSL